MIAVDLSHADLHQQYYAEIDYLQNVQDVYHMAAKKGFSPNDPYQNGGGMCTTCKLKIPKERLTELTYPADRNGSIRCKECSNQIRFHPRRSGRCRHNGKTFKREESIARY